MNFCTASRICPLRVELKSNCTTNFVPLHSTFLDFIFRFSFAGAYEKQEVCGVTHHLMYGLAKWLLIKWGGGGQRGGGGAAESPKQGPEKGGAAKHKKQEVSREANKFLEGVWYGLL